MAVCSVHGKNRTMTNLEEDGMGGFMCKDMYKCNTGDGSGGGKGSGADGDTCSTHNKFRTSSNLMSDGMGGKCCKPGNQCQGGGKGAAVNWNSFGMGQKGGGDAWVDNLQNKTLPGDWTCDACGDHQFAKNAACRNCGAAKPDGVGAPKGSPKGGKGVKGVKGSKGCMGGKSTGMGGMMDMLWGKFLEDMGCGGGMAASFGKASGKGGGGGCGAGGAGGMVCSIHGKARTAGNLTDDGFGGYCCKPGYECQTGGGAEQPVRTKGQKGGGDVWVDNLQNKMMNGDWSCPGCGDHQFARNTNCRKCGEARPAGAGIVPQKPGDWICPGCEDLQFARNPLCRKCGHAKPEGVESAGPYGAG